MSGAAAVINKAKDIYTGVVTGTGITAALPGVKNAANTTATMGYDYLTGKTPDAAAAPEPEAPPASPTDTAGQVDDAAAKQRRARGRASTYLTGSQGLTTSATTASRTLLGG